MSRKAIKTSAEKTRVVKIKEKEERKQEAKEVRNKRKQKKTGMMEVKQLVEEWKIQNEKEKTTRFEKEAKKLILPRFQK